MVGKPNSKPHPPGNPHNIYGNLNFAASFPAPSMSSHAPMPDTEPVTTSHQSAQSAANQKIRRPLQPTSTNLAPSTTALMGEAKKSPVKSRNPDPVPPINRYHSQPTMSSMAPPPSRKISTEDLRKKPVLSKFKTSASSAPRPAHLETDSSLALTEKENMGPAVFSPQAVSHSRSPSMEMFPPIKANAKRSLMEAAPIKDCRPTKKAKQHNSPSSSANTTLVSQDGEANPDLPAWDSFQPITDDGQKPGHSYAQLIGMAILRSPNRRLTLAQIYKWISDTYTFYGANDAGWQNSIRHNLSLNKAFAKMERSKDDPGKGNYWYIVEGMEQQFIKEKPARKTSSASENVTMLSTGRPETPSATKARAQPQLHMMGHRSSTKGKHVPAASSNESGLPPLSAGRDMGAPAADVSSDATIPMSDTHGQDELNAHDDATDVLEPLDYSPLPAGISSSPPVSRHYQHNIGGTPPSIRITSSAATRKKTVSMDDSGYISSLDSSVMRSSKLLTSGADRPRHKRGRAEEEIARLRASSYDSPTKNRSTATYAHAPPSSSPIRTNNTQLLNPLTPAIKFKASIKPPASASPNTNLKLHRDRVHNMLESPIRKMTGLFGDGIPWSPAFKLEESAYLNDTMVGMSHFDPLDAAGDDDIFEGLSSLDQGSPIKRSIKRSHKLDRSQSLLDTPAPKIWEDDPPALLDTPSRAFEGFPIPNKQLTGSPLKISRLPPACPPPPPKITTPTTESSSLMPRPGPKVPSSIQAPELPWAALNYPDGLTLDDPAEVAGLDMLQGFKKLGEGEPTQPNRAGSGSRPAGGFFPMF